MVVTLKMAQGLTVHCLTQVLLDLAVLLAVASAAYNPAYKPVKPTYVKKPEPVYAPKKPAYIEKPEPVYKPVKPSKPAYVEKTKPSYKPVKSKRVSKPLPVVPHLEPGFREDVRDVFAPDNRRVLGDLERADRLGGRFVSNGHPGRFLDRGIPDRFGTLRNAPNELDRFVGTAVDQPGHLDRGFVNRNPNVEQRLRGNSFDPVFGDNLLDNRLRNDLVDPAFRNDQFDSRRRNDFVDPAFRNDQVDPRFVNNEVGRRFRDEGRPGLRLRNDRDRSLLRDNGFDPLGESNFRQELTRGERRRGQSFDRQRQTGAPSDGPVGGVSRDTAIALLSGGQGVVGPLRVSGHAGLISRVSSRMRQLGRDRGFGRPRNNGFRDVGNERGRRRDSRRRGRQW